MKQPDYFKPVQKEAKELWDELEEKPQLAGPWHLLFKQVQYPYHVLSELLQNADDANATQATVKIQGDELIFCHNGDDFNKEQFRSLCGFGSSNKRVLHTIGFRGIGFKSTFSIGDDIKLFTPTLSVQFNYKRFCEPIWIDSPNAIPSLTEIHVKIKDLHRRKALEKNFQEWLANPVSLLFFGKIRSLQISGTQVKWESFASGPVANSTWMNLTSEPDRKYLLIQSEVEKFPEDALQEVKDERLVIGEDIDLPPCRVDIVLGAEGRLFVVLPTGVVTKLPFACNAPFIQDPARINLKDPEISVTNRWLLGRIGRLAAHSLTSWVSDKKIDMLGRCNAYDLWPQVGDNDTTIQGRCGKIVEEEFKETAQNTPCLLLEKGKLEKKNNCIVIPSEINDVWSSEVFSSNFDSQERPPLYSGISSTNVNKIIHHDFAEEITKSKIVRILEERHLPKPSSWRQLMNLWAYLADEVTRYYGGHKNVRILPVQGQDVLYDSSEVIRLGKDQLLQSDDDWQFLSNYVLTQNPNWLRYLSEQRTELQNKNSAESNDQIVRSILAGQVNPVESAYKVLSALGLAEASDVGNVMARVTTKFFSQQPIHISDCVRLTHIAAKLNASIPDNFRYVTKDKIIHLATYNITADLTNDVDSFADNSWCLQHVLHEDYFKPSLSCTENEWKQWVLSERSKLSTFIPLKLFSRNFYNQESVKAKLLERGFTGQIELTYKTSIFRFEDWNFDQDRWDYWNGLAQRDHLFWVRVLGKILQQPQNTWVKTMQARCYHVATTGNSKQATQNPLPSGWVMKFRGLPCLQDTWGNPRYPAELMLRTPDTEVSLGTEPFVVAEVDTPSNRPLLLALGVNDTPTGPERYIERIKTLSKTNSPPVQEVLKWYQILDRLVFRCSSEQFQTIKTAFEHDKLILIESGNIVGWVRLQEAFMSGSDADVPGAPVIHPMVRGLILWQKLGVAQKPTAELAIGWLKTLQPEKALTSDELRRVRALLPLYPERIWNECGYWIDLESRWTSVSNLKYSWNMQSMAAYSHLFPSIKQQTANLQDLSETQSSQLPFSTIPRLLDSIEDRLQETLFHLSSPKTKDWIQTFGSGLERIILANEAVTLRTRDLGHRLSNTMWQDSQVIETIPYINGAPAGTARTIPALWKDMTIYVAAQSRMKAARVVSKELSNYFDKEISDAILLCYDRSAGFVTEYLEENFKLAPIEEIKAAQTEKADIVQSTPTANEEPTENVNAGNKEQESGTEGESEPEVETQTADENTQENNEDGSKDEETKTHKPPKPTMIELFAKANDFSKDGDDKYHKKDGSWLERTHDNGFHWEMHDKSGELKQYYWLKDHCIESEPLQMDVIIWKSCESFPQKYSIVLADRDGNPEAIPGYKLMKLRDDNLLELNPASYRLVYKNERENT